jgi:uncharacterized protein YbbK (DUF523 family)
MTPDGPAAGLPKIGVSACLLGRAVRYDGGHKRDAFLVETLGPRVAYVPVCPEADCGFPVPREPMRLEGDPAAPRLVTVHTGVDHTERLVAWAERRLGESGVESLAGFVFKKGSPSCAIGRIEVVDGASGVPREGRGIFAGLFADRFPEIPLEDEERLADARRREAFLRRIGLGPV